jgi:crossover junction endodeoxyribonuclease RuvC
MTRNPFPRRILGIDPGLRLTGFGCIDIAARSQRGSAPTIIEAGVIRLTLLAKSETARTNSIPTAGSVSARLVELDRDFRALLERTSPDALAIEGLFAHYKHPATAIVMGHARGVLLLAAQQAGLALVEVKPNEVKKSLTGFGHAGKDQVQRVIQQHFALAKLPTPADMADALAIALCGAQRLERAAVIPTSSRRRPGSCESALPDRAAIHDPLAGRTSSLTPLLTVRKR